MSKHDLHTKTPQTTREEIANFFQGWDLYMKIVQNDYMPYRELLDRFCSVLADFPDRPLRILDLGCGDCYVPAGSLRRAGRAIESYTAVDLAGMALDYAQVNLEPLEGRKDFRIGDQLVVAKETKEPVDIVVAGFTQHHLQREEKSEFYDHLRGLLAPGGCFVLWDCISQGDEGRNGWIERMLAYVDREWKDMTPQEIEMIREHISTKDYPESMSWFDDTNERVGATMDPIEWVGPDKVFAWTTFRF